MKGYSQRLQSLIDSRSNIVVDRLYQGNLYSEGVALWRGQVSENGKILSLGIVEDGLTELELGISLALCQVLRGESRLRLLNISLREVENYLRDKNGEAAFAYDQKVETFFFQASLALMQAWVLAGLGFERVVKRAWPTTAIARIHFMKDWVQNVGMPLLEGELEEIEVVNINPDEVVLQLVGIKKEELAPAYMSALKHFLEKEVFIKKMILSFEQ